MKSMLEGRFKEPIPRSAGEITFHWNIFPINRDASTKLIGAPDATALVIAQPGNRIVGFLQAAGQDGSIFESLTPSLPEMRGHWVSCVAEQRHSARSSALMAVDHRSPP